MHDPVNLGVLGADLLRQIPDLVLVLDVTDVNIPIGEQCGETVFALGRTHAVNHTRASLLQHATHVIRHATLVGHAEDQYRLVFEVQEAQSPISTVSPTLAGQQFTHLARLA